MSELILPPFDSSSPDLALLENLRRAIAVTALDFSAIEFPPLHQALGRLSSRLGLAHKLFFRNVLSVRAALNNLQLQPVIALLKSLDPVADREPVQMHLEHARQVLDGVHGQLVAMLSAVQEQVGELASIARPDISEHRDTLTRRLSQVDADLLVENTAIGLMDSAVSDLTEALKVFKVRHIEDIFKDMLPSPEEVDLILKTTKTQTVDAELIKQSVKKIEQHLGVVGEARRFKRIVAALEEKRQALERRRVVASQFNRRRNQLAVSLASLESAMAAWDRSEQWREQVGKLLATLRECVKLNVPARANDAASLQMIGALLMDWKTYFNALEEP